MGRDALKLLGTPPLPQHALGTLYGRTQEDTGGPGRAVTSSTETAPPASPANASGRPGNRVPPTDTKTTFPVLHACQGLSPPRSAEI